MEDLEFKTRLISIESQPKKVMVVVVVVVVVFVVVIIIGHKNLTLQFDQIISDVLQLLFHCFSFVVVVDLET